MHQIQASAQHVQRRAWGVGITSSHPRRRTVLPPLRTLRKQAKSNSGTHERTSTLSRARSAQGAQKSTDDDTCYISLGIVNATRKFKSGGPEPGSAGKTTLLACWSAAMTRERERATAIPFPSSSFCKRNCHVCTSLFLPIRSLFINTLFSLAAASC